MTPIVLKLHGDDDGVVVEGPAVHGCRSTLGEKYLHVALRASGCTRNLGASW
jgi:hypothetical protein